VAAGPGASSVSGGDSYQRIASAMPTSCPIKERL